MTPVEKAKAWLSDRQPACIKTPFVEETTGIIRDLVQEVANLQCPSFCAKAADMLMNDGLCDWTPWNNWENPGCYDTACGQTQYFSEENIKGNNYIYCPYCGKQIFEKEAELNESDCNGAE